MNNLIDYETNVKLQLPMPCLLLTYKQVFLLFKAQDILSPNSSRIQELRKQYQMLSLNIFPSFHFDQGGRENWIVNCTGYNVTFSYSLAVKFWLLLLNLDSKYQFLNVSLNNFY